MMPFYADPQQDLAIAQIPRSGNTSIHMWLGRSFAILKNEDPVLLGINRRVMFIRNPFERLKSAFSLMYWLRDTNKRENKSRPDITEWPSFVDYVLNPDVLDDIHWRPQLELCGGVSNICHKFENLYNHWEKYKPGILVHAHMTSRRPTSDYRMREIAEKYTADLAAWEMAN